MLNAWHLPVPPFLRRRGDRLYITLLLSAESAPSQVFLRGEPDNEEWLLPMSSSKQGEYIRYHTTLALHEGEDIRRYCFKLLWPERQQWFGPRGFSAIPPGQLEQFAVSVPDSGPDWVADQIFYQIFPDRFFSSGGDYLLQNDSYFHHAAGRWSTRSDWKKPLSEEGAASDFYGGDLDGISSKLPYLRKLGVTALYLNPIFTAPSVHKYDTHDYYHVDPFFGGNEALVRLREKSRKMGIKLVLDGVFNHAGDSHPWFDRHKLSEKGACHHPDSPYRGWFSFWPDGTTRDWKGYSSLPKLNYADPEVVQRIYKGDDSVVRHWLRPPYSIDGWRLDVVHMLGEHGGAKGNLHHLAGIYQAAKDENPQAYILGEHFGDARRWLHAGVEDAAMNYMGFALPLRAFLTGIDIAMQPVAITASECAEWMENYRAGLSHQTQLRQFNQLDSHDTARFLTLLNGNIKRMRMAVVWMYTWIGVPCIYYGDEVGLDGGNDPFCRKPFPWEESEWNHDLLALYRQMSALRQQNKALRHGGCLILHSTDDTLVFVRAYQQERILIAIQRNASATATLPLSPLVIDGRWQCLEGEGVLTSQTTHLHMALPAESVTVWRLIPA